MSAPFLEVVRKDALPRSLYLPHALDAMNSPTVLITADEVRQTIFHGQMIEEYPEDVRGHSSSSLTQATASGRFMSFVPPKKRIWRLLQCTCPTNAVGRLIGKPESSEINGG